MIVKPGRKKGTVLTSDGEEITIPDGWQLLPPGDAACTRKVKAMGDYYQVQEKRGRRTYSKGVWAPSEHIESVKKELEALRSSSEYKKKRATDLKRKERKHKEYEEDFHGAIINYLNFAPVYKEYAEKIARLVTAHATPVGSGTVARTERIPIEKRAEAAVIAWMRHKTTNYDYMTIARQKGERRRVRRKLAEDSVKLLASYRQGAEIPARCPLLRTLKYSQ